SGTEGTGSMSVYLHWPPNRVGSKPCPASTSTIRWLVAQRMVTAPKGGCGNENLYVTPSALVTPLAGVPATSRSEASTPETGLVKVTATAVRPVIVVEAGGICEATLGLLGLMRK